MEEERRHDARRANAPARRKQPWVRAGDVLFEGTQEYVLINLGFQRLDEGAVQRLRGSAKVCGGIAEVGKRRDQPVIPGNLGPMTRPPACKRTSR